MSVQSATARRGSKSKRSTEKFTRIELEATCHVDQLDHLESVLRARVHGQYDAVDALVCACTRFVSGLRDPGRPLLTALLMGPTGVGKTETAKAIAEALFGSERAMTRINCEEYAHGHEVSKLLGSPPGYVGHAIEPILSQSRIDGPHHDYLEAKEHVEGIDAVLLEAGKGQYASVVLFDEIEKAHPTLWNALLGILEDGMLTLGNNETTDFTRSIILMTSNVGSHAMGELLEHSTVVGFEAGADDPTGSLAVQNLAMTAARESFPPEFLNRFDEVLVYCALEREHLDTILDKFIGDLHRRALVQARVPLRIQLSAAARALIIDAGTDPRFGARPLRRAFERHVVDPISQLLAGNALGAGDVVEIDVSDGELAFYRRGRFQRELVS